MFVTIKEKLIEAKKVVVENKVIVTVVTVAVVGIAVVCAVRSPSSEVLNIDAIMNSLPKE